MANMITARAFLPRKVDETLILCDRVKANERIRTGETMLMMHKGKS